MSKQEKAIKAIMDAWYSHAPEDAEMPIEIQLCKEALDEIESCGDRPIGFWQGEFGDGGATLYEVPQESAFGRTYRNYPVYAEGHRNIRPLGVDEWHRHWQVSHALDATDVEIKFDDFLLIAQDVEAVYGIKPD